MKRTLFLLVGLLAVSMATGQPSRPDKPALESQPAKRPDLGILDVYDNQIALNHNQAFKRYLNEQALAKGKHTMHIELIEHPSQAAYAIRAIIDSTALYASLYADGQLTSKDTLSLDDLGIRQEGYAPSFQLAELSDGGIIVTGLSPNSPVYKLGVRNGHSLMKVNTTAISDGELRKAQNLLWSTRKEPLSLTLYNPDSRKSYVIKAPLIKQTRIMYNRPYSHKDVVAILDKLTTHLLRHHPDMKRKPVKPASSQTLGLIGPLYGQGNCKAYSQIATYDPASHPISYPTRIIPRNSLVGGAMFSHEKFRENTNMKKTYQPGDAALLVMNYYNYTQNRTSPGFTKKVGQDLQSAIGHLSGPYYNKPGVFFNYYLAGFEYERNKRYTAALNQYYASLRKIDDIIAGPNTILNAKTMLAERIAYCSRQLGQHEYGRLMELAAHCLSAARQSEELRGAEENFYAFCDDVASTAKTIEEQLAEQRAQGLMAALQVATSVASGVASFNYDSGLSAAYFVDAFETMAANEDYNRTLNNMIRSSTETMEINLPAELVTDEVNPYEIKATQFIIESIFQDKLNPEALRQLEAYAAGEEALREALETFKSNHLITGQHDPLILLNALLRHETILYRYEKRGLPVPPKA